MQGLVLQEAGGEFHLLDNVEKPKHATGQILVKAIAVAINPVDIGMHLSGSLVTSWPIVLGCDSAGVVVEVGQEASSFFKKGDHVCGCTRLGQPGYGAFQEYFLMDANLAIPRPEGLSDYQAATIGVGSLTACLGIFAGSNIPVSQLIDNVSTYQNEWIIVLGGSGSVGQYAIQLAKICGFSVLTTCSAKSTSLVKGLGAKEVIDYNTDEIEKLGLIRKITRGNFSRVYDTTGKSSTFAFETLLKISSARRRFFMTTDPGFNETHSGEIESYTVNLGLIGRMGADLESWPTLNSDLASYIPILSKLFNNGSLVPNDLMLIKESGLEGVREGFRLYQEGGSRGKKIVIDVQSDS